MITGHRLVACAFRCVCLSSLLAAGCGSNWRVHDDERPIPTAQISTSNAPEWVRGAVPMDESMVFFVGRSSTPDMHRRGGGAQGARGETPDGRVGFTVMDERDAIQSARTDVQDQILQRLMPRNFGTTGQTVSQNMDVGTCLHCEQSIGMVSTATQARCNEPCYRSPSAAWTNAAQGLCSTCAAKVGSNQPTEFMPGTTGSHSPVRTGSTLFSQMVADYRRPDYLPMLDGQIARDINVFNLGIDSVMPALMAQLQEEKTYFEKWAVKDAWMSYKCWILCAIPRSEFMKIADEFRSRYESLYQTAIERIDADRDRRIILEDAKIKQELEWQAEERRWNRDDELTALDHMRELDKDREPLPGRRFRVTNGGTAQSARSASEQNKRNLIP